jgi:aspartate racemase
MSKTIGVLGGMGPYATLDFLRLILDLTGAAKESEHFRVVIDSNPRIPSRTRAYLFGDADPVPMMRESATNLLHAGADFIVLPCNSAHYFLPRVLEGAPFQIVDMVESTSKVIVQQGWKTVGVLAGEVTVGARLYEKYLMPHGINVVQVSAEEQKFVRKIIEDVKNNEITAQTGSGLAALIDILVKNGAQSIILGCTELQAVIRKLKVTIPIVDSLEVLARAAIAEARSADAL